MQDRFDTVRSREKHEECTILGVMNITNIRQLYRGYKLRDRNLILNLQYVRYMINKRLINNCKRMHVFLIALFWSNSHNCFMMFLKMLTTLSLVVLCKYLHIYYDLYCFWFNLIFDENLILWNLKSPEIRKRGLLQYKTSLIQ